jgi:hypothetical protein
MDKRVLLREFWEVQGRTGVTIFVSPQRDKAVKWKEANGYPSDRLVRVRRYAVSTLKPRRGVE